VILIFGRFSFIRSLLFFAHFTHSVALSLSRDPQDVALGKFIQFYAIQLSALKKYGPIDQLEVTLTDYPRGTFHTMGSFKTIVNSLLAGLYNEPAALYDTEIEAPPSCKCNVWFVASEASDLEGVSWRSYNLFSGADSVCVESIFC